MNLALLRLDRIGDFVLGIPVYRALRKKYPSARVTVLVPSEVGNLAEACPYFDEVVLFDALWLRPGQTVWNRWRSALKLVRYLRGRAFDQVLDFRYQSNLDPLVTGLSGAKTRAGFALGPGRVLLTASAPVPSSGLHQVERNLLLLDRLGVPRDGSGLEMWVSERDRKITRSHLPSQESLPNVPRVAVHIGAATPAKRWGEESFTSLLHELHATTQADLVLLGGAEDSSLAREIMDDLKCPASNLVGRLSLRELAAVLRECAVFVGCDSGPAHLAAACGTGVVSLFSGANDPNVWRPWGDRVRVLSKKPDCSPCESHQCLRTDGYFCMDEIGVEEVVEAVRGMLERRG